MKVYFEENGWIGSQFGGNKYGVDLVEIQVYVKPDGDGSAIHYDLLGGENEFSWAYPENARVYNSSELPKELWYSIRHGLEEVTVFASKAENWTFDDLIYDKVDPKDVRIQRKIEKEIENVKTIEDFKNLYPTIKKSHNLQSKVVETLLTLMDVPKVPCVNGELGLQMLYKYNQYRRCLFYIGLMTAEEYENFYK